jgi:hypothetical protein
MIKKVMLVLWLVSMLLVTGCASKGQAQSQADPASPAETKVVKSMDGSYTGEIIGTIDPDSKFAKLKIGMMKSDVQALINPPDDMRFYESGKRWIPFYFGNDARRAMAYYEGEGCLTYTDGGGFGIPGGQLIRIHADKTGGCFK